MKIAYMSSGRDPYARRFLEKMVERGHKPYPISYFPGEIPRIEGVELYKYDYHSLGLLGHFVSLGVAVHLRRLLGKIQPDVLHTGYVKNHGYLGALAGFHPTLSMPWGSDILIEPDKSFERIILRHLLVSMEYTT